MTDSNTIVSGFERYRQILADAKTKNKAAVFDALAIAGITRVTVSFDGEGDSGQIEEVAAFRGEESCELPALLIGVFDAGWDKTSPTERRLRVAIESLCYDFLSDEYGGWENNEGAFGVFEFDVSKGSVELELDSRFVDILTSHHMF